jgi:hypothetical protein
LDASEAKTKEKLQAHSKAVTQKDVAWRQGNKIDTDLWLTLHQYLIAVFALKHQE